MITNFFLLTPDSLIFFSHIKIYICFHLYVPFFLSQEKFFLSQEKFFFSAKILQFNGNYSNYLYFREDSCLVAPPNPKLNSNLDQNPNSNWGAIFFGSQLSEYTELSPWNLL